MKHFALLFFFTTGCAAELATDEDVALIVQAQEYAECALAVMGPNAHVTDPTTNGGAETNWITGVYSQCGAITGNESVKITAWAALAKSRATATITNNTNDDIRGHLTIWGDCVDGLQNVAKTLQYDLGPQETASRSVSCGSGTQAGLLQAATTSANIDVIQDAAYWWD